MAGQELILNCTGEQIDEAIQKFNEGWVLPDEIITVEENIEDLNIVKGKLLNVRVPIPTFKTQTKTVQSSRISQTIVPDSEYDGFSSVTVNALNHTRLSKTIGSSATQTCSIPLSEIGFVPRIFAITLYMSNINQGSQLQIICSICDMQNLEVNGSSTSGMVLAASSASYDASSFGISLSGAVNGNNFVFTATYGYFRPNGTYRFFFWG